MAKHKKHTPYKPPRKPPIQVIQHIGDKSGIGHFVSDFLPQSFFGQWTARRYVNALRNAETINNMVELDALYSWVFRVSSLWNGLWNMRSTPFFSAVVDVYSSNGEWNEEITQFFQDSNWFYELRKEYILSVATGMRCGAVFGYEPKDARSGHWYSFPMRNLDWINRGLREGTYQWESVKESAQNENLFWFQPHDNQEQRFGLLQSAAKSIINYENANKNWINSALLYASPKVKMLYEHNNTTIKERANEIVPDLMVGGVPMLPSHYHPDTGELIPEIDVKGWEAGGTQDVFRVFGELKQQEAGDLSLLLLGSTMMGVSSRSAYSEWLVKVGYKELSQLVKQDIDGFFKWLNEKETKVKLALVSGYTELVDMEFTYETSTSIDAIDIAVYSQFLKDSGYQPTEAFMSRVGLSPEDYEKLQNPKQNGNTGGTDQQGGNTSKPPADGSP